VDWDDLRFVLATARAGSALRAARELCVNQSTVLRKLDALEARLGTALFERQRSGLTPTDAGRTALDAAERMEAEVSALITQLAARRRQVTGLVRLTTSESLAGRLVTPGLRAFHKTHPGVSVELLVSDERLDLARGDADMAIRAGSRPARAGVVARRLPDAEWTVYCSRRYAEERGAPANRDAIAGHDIVAMEGRMATLPGSMWLAASAPNARAPCRSNSLTNLVTALKAGLGLGALPTIDPGGDTRLPARAGLRRLPGGLHPRHAGEISRPQRGLAATVTLASTISPGLFSRR
jgi:DNA-binding transcriptional LysR family regulator